jgi:hypothetical protein
MTHRTWTGRIGPVVALLLAAAVTAAAGDRERITVRLLPTTIVEHQDMKAMVLVEAEAGNRRLVVALDGPAFYSSTQRTLNGTAGPRAHEFFFRALPAGTYHLRISVEDAQGRKTSLARDFEVHGITDAEEAFGPRPRRP